MDAYVEHGGSWRPCRIVAGAFAGREEVRLPDGRTVLAPTRDPAALYEALTVRVADTSDTRDRAPVAEGTLGS